MRLGGETRASFVNMHEAHHKNYCHRRFGYLHDVIFSSIFCFPIDLFGLYILFSHFRPRDATPGNSFFQMSSYARANLRITNEKTKGKFS